jgi:hypothetical protein
MATETTPTTLGTWAIDPYHNIAQFKEFGMTYSPALETGGVAVGDRVKVPIHFEAVRQG